MSRLGAVLRASGSKSNVERFLARTSWHPIAVYWKGKRRFKSSKSVSQTSGFNVGVSNAEGLDLRRQLRDATRFVRRHEKELRRMRRLKLHSVLDFGVEVRDVDGPAFFRFPLDTLRTLAKYGIELEVSYYGKKPS